MKKRPEHSNTKRLEIKCRTCFLPSTDVISGERDTACHESERQCLPKCVGQAAGSPGGEARDSPGPQREMGLCQRKSSGPGVGETQGLVWALAGLQGGLGLTLGLLSFSFSL